MLLVGVPADEAAIKIVDEVGSAPIEMGQDGRGIGRDQAADDQTEKADRHELEHGRIGDIVPEERGVEVGEGRLDIGQVGKNDERTQGDQDPGPGPEDVMGQVEKEDRAERIPLRLAGQHPLGDIAPSAGLGPGIPDRPPLDGDRHDEHRQGDVPVVLKVGQHAQIIDPVRTGLGRDGGDHRRKARPLRGRQTRPRR